MLEPNGVEIAAIYVDGDPPPLQVYVPVLLRSRETLADEIPDDGPTVRARLFELVKVKRGQDLVSTDELLIYVEAGGYPCTSPKLRSSRSSRSATLRLVVSKP
jgi:hypothetical protein